MENYGMTQPQKKTKSKMLLQAQSLIKKIGTEDSNRSLTRFAKVLSILARKGLIDEDFQKNSMAENLPISQKLEKTQQLLGQIAKKEAEKEQNATHLFFRGFLGC
ncbi:MAG: hypothetical protein N3E51_02185 [Candidatus Micrarchaeota archaeon]|nr:hypothetical protein [Candidatus Micrarchaeota archaeon]